MTEHPLFGHNALTPIRAMELQALQQVLTHTACKQAKTRATVHCYYYNYNPTHAACLQAPRKQKCPTVLIASLTQRACKQPRKQKCPTVLIASLTQRACKQPRKQKCPTFLIASLTQRACKHHASKSAHCSHRLTHAACLQATTQAKVPHCSHRLTHAACLQATTSCTTAPVSGPTSAPRARPVTAAGLPVPAATSAP